MNVPFSEGLKFFSWKGGTLKSSNFELYPYLLFAQSYCILLL